MMLQVTEANIVAAMKFHEAKAGARDGLTICKEVSKLADLLGVMWFAHQAEAAIPSDGRVAELLRAAGVEVAELADEPAEEIVEAAPAP